MTNNEIFCPIVCPTNQKYDELIQERSELLMKIKNTLVRRWEVEWGGINARPIYRGKADKDSIKHNLSRKVDRLSVQYRKCEQNLEELKKEICRCPAITQIFDKNDFEELTQLQTRAFTKCYTIANDIMQQAPPSYYCKVAGQILMTLSDEVSDNSDKPNVPFILMLLGELISITKLVISKRQQAGIYVPIYLWLTCQIIDYFHEDGEVNLSSEK